MWLTEVFGEGNPRKWDATSRFESVEECYEAFTHGDYYGLTYDETIKAQSVGLDNAKKTAEYCSKNGINIYCCESEGFPERLKDIYNPPSLIYTKSKLKNLDFLDDNVCVAVVGARNVDSYYEKVTEEISGQLAAAGITVASGFAVGVDTIAHKAAIKNGGKTVAVLGSGICYDYPKNTMKFKEEISENGVVISEFSPLHIPTPFDFKARNRILSGLSLGVLVTQASVTSGSLNTVSYAVSQGKDIFCVPPRDVFNDEYKGVVGILRDGAVPVFDARDVIGEYCENYSHKLSYSKTVMNYQLKSEDNAVFNEKLHKPKTSGHKKLPPSEQTEKNTEPQINFDELTHVQQRIVQSLKGKQLLADEISRETGIDIMELFGELTELEMSGVLKKLAGNRYSL